MIGGGDSVFFRISLFLYLSVEKDQILTLSEPAFLVRTETSASFSDNMDDEYAKLIRRMNPPRYMVSL